MFYCWRIPFAVQEALCCNADHMLQFVAKYFASFFAVCGSLLRSRTELADNHPQWTLYDWACECRHIFCKNCVITLASARSVQMMRKSHRATDELWKWLALLLLWRFRVDLFAPVYNAHSASTWFMRPPQFRNAFILVSWSSCSQFT